MSNEDPPNQTSHEQEPDVLEERAEGKTEETSRIKNYGQLSQSRSAILSAVIIIIILDLLNLLFLVLPGETTGAQIFPPDRIIIFSIIFDVFLGINLLRGKRWARTWMLIRLVLGTIIFGGVYIFQGDVASLILQTGLALALILLLTGVSTRLRIVGSVFLAIVTALVGNLWPLMTSLTTLPEVPETAIPETFETYTSSLSE